MPISCTANLVEIDQSHFQEIDQHVTGSAFDIHNQHGRLLNEKAYQNALLQRCIDSNQSCSKEVELKVSHKSFSKSYYLDLLINSGIIYEIKSSESISATNEAQLLNYLLLSNTKHGKILNFRTTSVTNRFVSASLSHVARQKYRVDCSRWRSVSNKCATLIDITNSLLEDWGSHLAINLYKEAIIHLLGGSAKLSNDIDLVMNGETVGKQQVTLLDPNTVLHLSAITREPHHYETHLRRFLNSTQLTQIQWVNFNGHRIQFSSIFK